LQYMRQYSAIKDRWVYLAALAFASAAYSLAHNFSNLWRMEVIEYLLWVSGGVSTVLGGTFAASHAAKAGIGFIPQTNSK
jgi:hypothetical protein